MPPPRKIATESTRQWATGLVVTATTMVCLFLFAKLSIWAVIIASASCLVGILVVSAMLGARQRRRR